MVEFPFHPNQGSVLKLDARKEFFLEKRAVIEDKSYMMHML